MKTVVIGDIHGRTIWKQIVKKHNDADKIVFVGDYLDTRENITGQQQLDNLKEILKYKKSNPTKVVLLFGNHDYHYLNIFSWETYSGYQSSWAIAFKEVLNKAIKEDLVQMCYIQNGYLFSHAGVSAVWCQQKGIDLEYRSLGYIDNQINDLFKHKPGAFRFNGIDPYGNDPQQSPIWIRPESLNFCRIPGFIQIVGHTTQFEGINIDKNPNIILVDALINNQFLIIEDDKDEPLKVDKI